MHKPNALNAVMHLYFDFFSSQGNGFSRKHKRALGKKQCEIFNIYQRSVSLMETSENKVTNENMRT